MAVPVPATVDATMPEIIAVPLALVLAMLMAATRVKIGAGI